MYLAFAFTLFVQSSPPAPQNEPPPRVSIETIQSAGKLAGFDFTPAQLEMMQRPVSEAFESHATLQKIPLDNSVPPALTFSPLLPGALMKLPRFNAKPIELSDAATAVRPANLEDLAYADIPTLAGSIPSSCASSTTRRSAR
jgi:hypothetical protein